MNPSPMNNQSNSSMTKWFVVALIGVAIIAAGAYFLTRPKSGVPVSNVDDAILQDIRQVSSGTSNNDIQADIDATNLQSLDDELNNLDQEIRGL